jgi:SMODS and SLOG-associating 2TM effector domain 1
MTERADQFAALYAEDRFGDQRDWYHQRRVEAEKARDQTIHAKWVFSTLAAMAGSVAAAVPDWRTGLAIAAAFLAATAASLTAFQTLFAFPRLAKLYKDAEMSLMALDAAGAAFRPGLSQAETRSLVERVEKVFLQENGQWGQLIQHATDEPGSPIT